MLKTLLCTPATIPYFTFPTFQSGFMQRVKHGVRLSEICNREGGEVQTDAICKRVKDLEKFSKF